MKVEKIFTLVILIVVALFLINFSIKVFNTFDAWLGITIGLVTATILVYVILKFITKLLK
jgi:hypothetical protein